MARETEAANLRTEDLLAQRTWLHALAAKLVRDQAERDDLVQETWLAALRHPLAGEARDLRQWLAAVLRNRWRFERRTRARRSAREQARPAGEPSPAPAELVEQAELQGVLVRAVLALEEPYRATVLRRYFGGETCRAIARAEGVPEGTVRSRLKRGLDSLRAELDRSSGGERRAWALALVPLARLARGRLVLTSAAGVAAALAVLWIGWSWSRGADLAPLEAAAQGAPAARDVVAAPSPTEPPERTPLAAETATGSPARLAAEGRLELLVLAPDGRPVADASVVCGSDEHEHHLRTGELGTCRIPDDVWSVASVPLQVDAPGFVRHDFPIDRGGFSWSSPFTVTVTPAVALEGHLRDMDTGRAIEGGELSMGFGYSGRALARATSGADGSFRLEPAPAGWEVELLIRAPAYPPVRKLVQVSSTERAHLELALSPGVELHGRIVDAWTGAPLAGALVFHDVNGAEGVPNDSAVELARSDAGGELVLRTLPEEELPVLLFFHPGYCSVRQNPRTDGFEIALLPAAVIEGTLHDDEGRAMSGSEVILDGLARDTWFERLTLEAPPDSPLSRVPGATPLFVPVWQTRTDGEGRFRMEVVPGLAGSKLTLHGLRHPDERWALELPLQPGETRPVEIAVRSAGTISGVLRINGEPSPGRVRYSSGKFFAGEWARPDGSFEIHGVPPGTGQLQAYPDEYDRVGYTPHAGRTHPVLAEVEVVAEHTQSVELDLALEMGTLRGHVTSSSGLPRAHASVEASAGRGNGTWRSVTGVDGAFELRVPTESASYELRVQNGPPVSAPLNTDGIELVSKGYGRIRLRAEDAASHAVIERVTLFARRARPGWESAGEFSTGTNGFAQWELEAGPLELAAGKPEDGYPSTFLGRFTLTEDVDLELDVAMEHVVPTQFVLTNPPLPGVCGIRLEPASGLPQEGGMFGGGSALFLPLREGHASVPGLARDTYRVFASFPDVVIEPAEIQLGTERSQAIELTWHRRD